MRFWTTSCTVTSISEIQCRSLHSVITVKTQVLEYFTRLNISKLLVNLKNWIKKGGGVHKSDTYVFDIVAAFLDYPFMISKLKMLALAHMLYFWLGLFEQYNLVMFYLSKLVGCSCVSSILYYKLTHNRSQFVGVMVVVIVW